MYFAYIHRRWGTVHFEVMCKVLHLFSASECKRKTEVEVVKVVAVVYESDSPGIKLVTESGTILSGNDPWTYTGKSIKIHSSPQNVISDALIWFPTILKGSKRLQLIPFLMTLININFVLLLHEFEHLIVKKSHKMRMWMQTVMLIKFSSEREHRLRLPRTASKSGYWF